MLQTPADALTVAEGSPAPAEEGGRGAPDELPDVEQSSIYDDADASFALDDYDYPVPGFTNELLAELEKPYAPEDAQLVDRVDPSPDIDDGLLVAFPDESVLFLGEDPTTYDAMPWYGFTVEPMAPVPRPETASDALDLLRPPDVQAETDAGWFPNRHGEWWLLPTQKVPLSDRYQPGVASQPYGPSPLGNHVPQTYAFTEPADAIVAAFHEHTASAPASIDSVPELLQWTWRQQQKHPDVQPPDVPEWADIRAWGGEVLVRGSIRHRENDHYVEQLGDRWFRALTHRMEVYTADALGEGVHLDYYGQ